MENITSLNKQLDLNKNDYEEIIEELIERDEMLCTAEGCGAQINGW